MKKIKHVLIAMCLGGIVMNEAGAQSLRLKNGTYTPTATTLEVPQTQQYGGSNYYVIQFKQTPTLAQQKELRASGINLMMYLPDHAYFASSTIGLSTSFLSTYNVHALLPITNMMKQAPSIYKNNIPAHALRNNNAVELMLQIHQVIAVESALSAIAEHAIEIVSVNKALNIVQIIAPLAKINVLTQFAFVQAIEPIGPVGEPENYLERPNHRTNIIASDYNYNGALHYNGEGVVVGIGDDGVIGPHIDYTGRTDQSLASGNNGGDHGDHCSGILMGAGNLDPRERGQAWGAQLYVYDYPDDLNDADAGYDNQNIRITSSSYSDGCNAGYTAFSQQCDQQIRLRSEMMHSFSAGNQGGNNCGYGAGGDFGNITGGHKIGKNVISAASLTSLDAITNYSSRGPTADGRIAPIVSAVGDNVNSTLSVNTYGQNSGTSMSCPAVSGALAQLYHAYKENNGQVTPQSGVIKAILMNTCDDLGNVGPDYTFGYGRINGRRAVKVIQNHQHLQDTVSQGNSWSFDLPVPANVAEARVLVYWHDFEAALAAAPALVNDLDMTMSFNGNTFLPYHLDNTPTLAALSAPATYAADHDNNHEQIVIPQPTAGTYTVTVNGFNIPAGVQTFFVTYEFVMEEVTVIHPVGGEGMAPGTSETIRWDSYGPPSSFTISYSTDSGLTYTNINANVNQNLRYLNWTVPNTLSGKVLVKVTKNSSGIEDVSDAVCNIMGVPTGLVIDWACPDSVHMSWNAVNGAIGYECSLLGTKYMDSSGTSTTTGFTYTNVNPFLVNWFSVKAFGPDGAISRRAVAISNNPGVFNCQVAIDGGLNTLTPSNGTLLSCLVNTTTNVEVEITNGGITPISNFQVTYLLNGGAPVTETYNGTINPGANATHTFLTPISIQAAGVYDLVAYTTVTNDGNKYNDTLKSTINVINAPAVPLPYSEDFESFTTCNTASDCAATICPLGNGLINETNGDLDDIDWRTNEGATPSNNTGPDFDHTTGNATGNYVYTEASNGCFGQVAQLLTPCIDLTTATAPALSFWYHMFGNNMGDLHIDIFSNGAWTNDVITPISGDQGNNWLNQQIGLTNYIGQIINVRFRGVTGPDFASDMALDDIGVASTSAINQIPQATNITVVPNPSTGVFAISVAGNNEPCAIEVTDIAGKVILSDNGSAPILNKKIDLSTNPKGVYILRVTTNGKTQNKKLVLN